MKYYSDGYDEISQKEKLISSVEPEDIIDIEKLSKEYEKELTKIAKELEQIKKEYYSKNIQLESIRKQSSYEIIKSIVQKYLNTRKE